MFQDWENIQQLSPREAAKIIFVQFEKSKLSDEMDSMVLYSEHMVEVGQYLKKKLADRAEKNGRQVENNLSLYIRLYVCESVCLTKNWILSRARN